ncbi:MAG: hypothetical protein WC624_06755 [Candidatus Margulisiibacteriota bacterium]
MDIVLVANSPGELSALVRPIAQKIKGLAKDARIILIMTPCQYASGMEVEFAQKNLAVDRVFSANDYKKWMFGGKPPMEFDRAGACLFLGGDLLHASLIAKKLGYKAYAYLPGKYINWLKAYQKFFLPDYKMFDHFFKKGIPTNKLSVVGDLMVDGSAGLKKQEAKEKWQLNAEHPIVAFMPGSRKWEIDVMLPLYEKIGENLKALVPDLKLMLIVSQFVPVDSFLKYQEHQIFDVFAPFDSVPAADMVITIPGTNTAQIAAQGVPMIVVFPLDRPEVIPLEGLVHYISSIPGLKTPFKKMIAWLVNKNTKYFALPNIKADREIVREIRGKIDPLAVAKITAEMLNDKEQLNSVGKSLKESMGMPGAADKIAREIINETL